MNVQPRDAPGYTEDPQLLQGNAAQAPTYVDTVRGSTAGSRPKGKNLTEVPRGQGFEGGEGRNASFESEIGTGMDPGRMAEKRMRNKGARGAIVGLGNKVSAGGQYDEIGETDA